MRYAGLQLEVAKCSITAARREEWIAKTTEEPLEAGPAEVAQIRGRLEKNQLKEEMPQRRGHSAKK